MQVYRDNFEEVLPKVKESIDEADFLCIDAEFTGICQEDNISTYDLPSQYYSKVYDGVVEFLCLQYGLASFKYDYNEKRYSSRTFNFYVFPKPANRCSPDTRFMCQSSCIDFLASNDFDFNKVFTQGIPYLTQSEEEAMKDAMENRRKFQAANNEQALQSPVTIPDQFKEQVQSACERLGELLKEGCETEEVKLDKCSAFVRKLIYQSAKQKYKDRLDLETKDFCIVGRKAKFSNADEKERDAQEKCAKEVDLASGFSKVIAHVATSGKMVIGHNMLLDICHSTNRFCDPIPREYQEFKEMVHYLFPKILDTKYMCSEPPLKDYIKSSILENLIDTIKDEPFHLQEIFEEDGYKYESSEGTKYHEAGYDAYTTGICFLTLLDYIKREADEKHGPASESEVLQKYVNRIFLMRTPDTYMNLSGTDPTPDRDHVFHLTFPKHWSNRNIAELFSPYGNVQISWVNSNTAWAALYMKSESSRATRSLTSGRGASSLPRGVRVTTYAQALKLQLQGNDGDSFASPRPNKRTRRSSSILDSSSQSIPETIPEEDEVEASPQKKVCNLMKGKIAAAAAAVAAMEAEEEEEEEESNGQNISTTFEVDEDWD